MKEASVIEASKSMKSVIYGNMRRRLRYFKEIEAKKVLGKAG